MRMAISIETSVASMMTGTPVPTRFEATLPTENEYVGIHRRGDGQLYVGMVAFSVFGWERVDEHGHWEKV